jgi:plasmid maintenance system antidote protein VapI
MDWAFANKHLLDLYTKGSSKKFKFMNKLKPFVNLGPGDTIREELEYLGWEQKDLAEMMGRTPKNISQLITNKAPLRTRPPVSFRKYLNNQYSSGSIWMQTTESA